MEIKLVCMRFNKSGITDHNNFMQQPDWKMYLHKLWLGCLESWNWKTSSCFTCIYLKRWGERDQGKPSHGCPQTDVQWFRMVSSSHPFPLLTTHSNLLRHTVYHPQDFYRFDHLDPQATACMYAIFLSSVVWQASRDVRTSPVVLRMWLCKNVSHI